MLPFEKGGALITLNSMAANHGQEFVRCLFYLIKLKKRSMGWRVYFEWAKR